jgi:hypothetical protein
MLAPFGGRAFSPLWGDLLKPRPMGGDYLHRDGMNMAESTISKVFTAEWQKDVISRAKFRGFIKPSLPIMIGHLPGDKLM